MLINHIGTSPLLKVIDNKSLFNDLSKNNILNSEQRYIFFYPLGSLYRLDPKVSQSEKVQHLFDAIPKNIYYDIKNGKCLLVIDNSNEGHLNPQSDYFLSLLNNLILFFNSNYKNIIILDQNRLITEEINCQQKFNDLRQKILFLNYDYFIKLLINNLSNSEKIEFPNYEDYYDRKSKVMLCLIGTARPSKLVLLNHIHLNNYYNNSIVSFGGLNSRKNDNEKYIFDQIIKLGYLDYFPGLNDVEDLIIYLKSIPSIYLDTSPDTELNNLAKEIPSKYYFESFFSVVPETEFTSSKDMQRVTEKTLKSFVMGHPNIVLGNPNSLSIMENFGFIIDDKLIDRSYDEINIPYERLAEVFRLLDETINLIKFNPESFCKQSYELSKYNYSWGHDKLHNHYISTFENPLINYFYNFIYKGSL